MNDAPVSPLRLSDSMFASDPVGIAMSDGALVLNMLAFEAALATAQGALGIIPADAAPVIAQAAAAFAMPQGEDWRRFAADAARAGTPVIPLVRALTAHVAAIAPDAAGFVHFGATSQDVMDTALVLQLRQAATLIDANMLRLGRAAAALAQNHRGTIMLGRTLLQPAVPITFGLKAAQWLSEIAVCRARLAQAAQTSLVLQFGGAAGTLGSLGKHGPSIAAGLAKALDLPLPRPALPWHTRRSALVNLGAQFAIIAGAAGKIARDVSLMMQFELGEVFEPSESGRGGSSAMPHKRNPVRCMQILANATRSPDLAAMLMRGMVQEHERALGGWQAEWAVWPDLAGLCGGSVSLAADMLAGLVVDAPRMRANFDALRGLPMTESVSLGLARKMNRNDAHAIVEAAARTSLANSITLRDALCADQRVSALFSANDIDVLLDPASLLQSADVFIDEALAFFAAQP